MSTACTRPSLIPKMGLMVSSEATIACTRLTLPLRARYFRVGTATNTVVFSLTRSMISKISSRPLPKRAARAAASAANPCPMLADSESTTVMGMGMCSFRSRATCTVPLCLEVTWMEIISLALSTSLV